MKRRLVGVLGLAVLLGAGCSPVMAPVPGLLGVAVRNGEPAPLARDVAKRALQSVALIVTRRAPMP